MPEVITTKPFAFREGGESRVVEAGQQLLSQACANHARSIGALEQPTLAAAESLAEQEAAAPAEGGQVERKRGK